MNSLISVCIPSYQRPELLNQAIESCLNQTYKNLEIIVCDDSKDDESERLVQLINKPEIIKYCHNRPSLKQANNVNRLFDLAQGDRLVLLHDDDLLMPTAIQDMVACWETEPDLTACFGKQYMINMQGDVLEDQSLKLNEQYYRTNEWAGLQTSSVWSAMMGQFPNNGYMILTSAAKLIRYQNTSNVGDACDYEFGLRLALKHSNFFFLNQYTSLYRITDISILRGNNYVNLTYKLIEDIQIEDRFKEFQSKRLQEYASPAINKWLELGNKHEANRIYNSEYYSWRRRLSPQGLTQAFLIACPNQLSLSLFNLLKRGKRFVNNSG